MHIIKRGAEAVLYLERKEGREIVVKDRIKKGYRIPELDDKIRSSRTKREDKMMIRAQRSGVNTPRVFSVEKTRLVMEYLKGVTVKDCLNTLPQDKRMNVYNLIGISLANMHRNGMVHGDLTTSNMILYRDKLYIIDFGLGKSSQRIEDQAVDIYLLKEALMSTHFKFFEESWKNIIKIYKQKYSNSTSVMKRLEKIESRRRYKHTNKKEN